MFVSASVCGLAIYLLVEHVVRAIKFGGAGHFDRGPGAALDGERLEALSCGADVDVKVARHAGARLMVNVREYRRCHRQVGVPTYPKTVALPHGIVLVVLGVGDAPAVVAAQELEAIDETRSRTPESRQAS